MSKNQAAIEMEKTAFNILEMKENVLNFSDRHAGLSYG
jgi:hypothetical protein